jgi:hypothetical protein
MSDARTWTGGAYWHRSGKTPWPKSAAVWATRYATWPFVKLRLDEGGGALLYARSQGPEVTFVWREIEHAERVRVLGIPLFGEGVRFTLKKQVAKGVPRRFFSWSKGRTEDILEVAESKGVRVERRAKNMFTVP